MQLISELIIVLELYLLERVECCRKHDGNSKLSYKFINVYIQGDK